MPHTKLDITLIQNLNLFTKLTALNAKNCFIYGNTMFFVVDHFSFQKAKERRDSSLRRLSFLLKKKVRIITLPDNVDKFIQLITYPVKYNQLINENGYITIQAGQQAKASLIGRNHARVLELAEILKQYYDIKGLRIV